MRVIIATNRQNFRMGTLLLFEMASQYSASFHQMVETFFHLSGAGHVEPYFSRHAAPHPARRSSLRRLPRVRATLRGSSHAECLRAAALRHPLPAVARS